MLTQEMIEHDFEQWNKRIETAKKKLLLLPTGWLPDYKQRKRNKDLQRKYETELIHVRGLFRIAVDGLKMNGFKVPVIGAN